MLLIYSINSTWDRNHAYVMYILLLKKCLGPWVPPEYYSELHHCRQVPFYLLVFVIQLRIVIMSDGIRLQDVASTVIDTIHNRGYCW